MKRIIILVLVVILISSCKRGGEVDPITKVDIYKGSDGLVMGFVEGAPPDEITASYMGEDSTFDIALELENQGAHNIGSGELTLILEKNYMDVKEWGTGRLLTYSVADDIVTFNLEGKSTKNPKGDKGIIYIEAKALEIPETQSEMHTSNILVTACYGYKTKLFEAVCVDADVHEFLVGEKVCEVKDISLKNQGAPVAVTKIEYSMLPHMYEERIKPQFKIHIQNIGDGQPTKPEAISKVCKGESLEHKDFNMIKIGAKLSDKELDCNLISDQEVTGEVRLKDKKGIGRCSLEEGINKEKGTYLTPLSVTLDYGYTSSISKEIDIKRPIEY